VTLPLPVKRKVMAYITHGNRLLVFRQPAFPDAGIQVPGGTIDNDEQPEVAVFREAFEETGLSNLTLGSFLGESLHDFSPRKPEIHQRHYFHLRVNGDVPETWKHWELHPSEGDHDRVLFELFWVDLPDAVPPLIAFMDEMIPRLVERLRENGSTARS
jgi:8-oxo-dGTP pyrophosphatase MutT (NUDIX family)